MNWVERIEQMRDDLKWMAKELIDGDMADYAVKTLDASTKLAHLQGTLDNDGTRKFNPPSQRQADGAVEGVLNE